MDTKITKRLVDQATPDNCDVLIWDCEVKGFGLRCRRSGAKHNVKDFEQASTPARDWFVTHLKNR